VAGSAAVEGMAVEPGVQADEVEGDGFVVVFEAGLGQAAVAGVSGVGDFDALGDGGLGPGAAGVLVLLMGLAFSGQLFSGLIYAASCRFRYSLWTSCGVL
jgi:hypothetical protein